MFRSKLFLDNYSINAIFVPHPTLISWFVTSCSINDANIVHRIILNFIVMLITWNDLYKDCTWTEMTVCAEQISSIHLHQQLKKGFEQKIG